MEPSPSDRRSLVHESIAHRLRVVRLCFLERVRRFSRRRRGVRTGVARRRTGPHLHATIRRLFRARETGALCHERVSRRSRAQCLALWNDEGQLLSGYGGGGVDRCREPEALVDRRSGALATDVVQHGRRKHAVRCAGRRSRRSRRHHRLGRRRSSGQLTATKEDHRRGEPRRWSLYFRSARSCPSRTRGLRSVLRSAARRPVKQHLGLDG